MTDGASGKARRPIRSSASAARRRSVSGCTGSVAAAVLRSQTGPQFSPRSWIASRARRARGSGCPDPPDTPDHGAVHSALPVPESRHADREHSNRSSRRRDERARGAPAAAATGLRVLAAAIEDRRRPRRGIPLCPTLSHFVPLPVPLCGPNPTESRRILPNSASEHSLPRVPGYPTWPRRRPLSLQVGLRSSRRRPRSW